MDKNKDAKIATISEDYECIQTEDQGFKQFEDN